MIGAVIEPIQEIASILLASWAFGAAVFVVPKVFRQIRFKGGG